MFGPCLWYGRAFVKGLALRCSGHVSNEARCSSLPVVMTSRPTSDTSPKPQRFYDRICGDRIERCNVSAWLRRRSSDKSATNRFRRAQSRRADKEKSPWIQALSLERAAGIEPATLAWKARALPLCNARAPEPFAARFGYAAVHPAWRKRSRNWWAGLDLNQRTALAGQIYSLVPLTTRPPTHDGDLKRYAGYQSWSSSHRRLPKHPFVSERGP